MLQQKGFLIEAVGRFLEDSRVRRVGFDPTQVTVGQLQSLRRAGGASVRWVQTLGKVESLRMRKDTAELAQMRRAAILAGDVGQSAIGVVKAGNREVELWRAIEEPVEEKRALGP